MEDIIVTMLCEDAEESETLNELVEEGEDVSVLFAANCFMAILRPRYPCIYSLSQFQSHVQ